MAQVVIAWALARGDRVVGTSGTRHLAPLHEDPDG